MTDDFYCEKVLETDDVLAFRHTRPFWPVHIVVVPKQHVPSLIDLGGADEALQHGACRVLTNLGRYQDSKHLHFHVNSGDPLR